METRSILHSDMNCFYASVEMMLDPSLRNKAVAVCGSTEDRHGIVLAKSELAKHAGVKTGMVNWEAKQRCPNLILVPPQYEQYLKFSALARAIYGRFTDLIEPFGMDECWLDVTASRGMCGSGMDIAECIRQTVKDELGLTVSIGVSFNKIYAKLGSDMKKPDAIVQQIFSDFMNGVNPDVIARKLNERGVPGCMGEPKWTVATIMSILENEKHMGDCILQKTYTADYLTKRMEKNEGHIEQYYVKDDHEALIDKGFWNATQMEIARRREYMAQHGLRTMGRYTDSQPFSNRVFCGVCGNVFWRRTLARLNGSIKVWMCGKRYQQKGVRGCNSESLKEADLHRAFIMAWNAILENRTEFLPKWKEQSQSDNPLTAFRARQFIKATESAEPMRMLDCALVSMVFDHCTVEPLGIINFYFLDGTQLGIEYKD